MTILISELSQINATARSHMERDTDAAGQWTCDCSDCSQVRELIGMDKVMRIWTAVRELNSVEEQLNRTTEGPEKQVLWGQYLTLLDELAFKMAGRAPEPC